MPWTVADVDEHKKGLTDAQKKRWVKVANSALKRCQDEDGEDCEASAIRQANSGAGKQEERAVEYRGYITSTNSALISVNAIDVSGKAVPVAELVAAYEGREENDADLEEAVWTTAFVNDLPDSSFAVIMSGGEKDEDSKTKPRSLRKLPYKDASGKVDIPHLRNALARLPQMKGVSAELKAKATKTLQSAAKKHLKTHQKENDFTEAVGGSLEDYAMSVKDAFRVAFKPSTVSSAVEIGYDLWPRDVFENDPDLGTAVVVRGEDSQLYAVEYKKIDDGFEFATRENWRRARLTYVLEEETTEVSEIQFSESASGHAVGLAEGQTDYSSPRAPLLMDVALIKPGWGNKKDGHYYPEEVLKRDARVFEGVKMYTTDHRPEEKSVRTEVAVIKACPVAFTNDGAPIARVGIHDGDFAEQARNRKELGTLESLECSILALGRTKKGEVDGEKANIVEAITKGQSVDWVTKAGAGGHALNLAESDIGGVNMDKEQIEKLLSESDLPQDAQERLAGGEYENEEAVKEAILKEQAQEKEAPQKLAEAEVEKLVEATKLPAAFKAALRAVEYDDEDAVEAAITEAVEEVKKATGSGRPFAQGDSQPAQDKPLSEKDKTVRFNEIMDRVGGRQVPVPAEQ